MIDELLADTASIITDLNAKVREAVMMGKPGEASDYAMALSSAASAYRDLIAADDE